MAASNATVFEVRPTGNDTNSGAFTVGATGTDYSQQTSPQYSVTDGVTAGTTTITSASAAFGTDVVGNFIYAQGGTGAVVAGWYQIITRTSATAIVVDRLTGLTAGTGVTLRIGGCLATVTGLCAAMASCLVPGGKAWVKGGTTYTQSAVAVVAAGSTNPIPFFKLSGYTTTRNDGGKATIQCTTGATGCLQLNMVGVLLENFILDCNNISGTTGVVFSQPNTFMRRCVVKNYTVAGASGSGSSSYVTDNEFTGGGSGATAAITTGAAIMRNWIHDNACPGIIQLVLGVCSHNLVTNNTGASSDGIRIGSSPGPHLLNNTIFGNGRHGIFFNAGGIIVNVTVKNNLIVSNVGAGLTISSGTIYADFDYDGNCYYNNTSGNRVSIDAVNATGGNTLTAYTNVLDVILTADPFTASGSNDFTLNNNAGGGAAARGSGNPATIATNAGVGRPDFGCYQHADMIVVNKITGARSIGTY